MSLLKRIKANKVAFRRLDSKGALSEEDKELLEELGVLGKKGGGGDDG